MGMEVTAAIQEGAEAARLLTGRPSILLVGPPDVGKRTILNRLTSKRESVMATSSTGVTCHGWTIDTKYYTADVCVWMVCLKDKTDNESRAQSLAGHCEALVMVFDLSNSSSFQEIQEWVLGVDLKTFEILLCVGNKADCVPSHFGHTKYRRILQNRGESSTDPHPEFMEFGIHDTEGSKLLLGADQEPLEDRRRSCIEWCSEKGIEYVEACAINEIFDKCISVDGDLQGLARIQGALSAHMWPELVMKPLSKLTEVAAVSQESEGVLSEEEADYLIEYELLSNASTEPWDGCEDLWSFTGSDAPAFDVITSSGERELATAVVIPVMDTQQHEKIQNEDTDASVPSSLACNAESRVNEIEEQIFVVEMSDSMIELETSAISPDLPIGIKAHSEVLSDQQVGRGLVKENRVKDGMEHGLEDLEQLMHEMASMRENMLTMSDRQRREMAAELAMRMASMFNDSSDGEDNDDQ